MPDSANLTARLHEALAFAARQVRGTIERHPDFCPMYTRGGQWKHEPGAVPAGLQRAG